MSREEIINKLRTEPVYLRNAFEEMAFKFMPGMDAKTFAKFRGKKEYQIDSRSRLVNDTFLEGDEISREEYETY